MVLSDEDLVARFLAGDHDAFAALYARYIDKLCQYTVHNTDHETGYDIAAETFLISYTKMYTLKAGKLFKAWLFQIATNLIKDAWRRNQCINWIPLHNIKEGQALQTLGLGTFGQSDFEQEVEDVDFIRMALLKVSETHRLCTYLAFFQGMKYVEIAAVLHMSQRTVRRRVSEGREQLHEYYRHLQQDQKTDREEQS